MAAPKFIRYPFASTGDKTTIPDDAQASGSVSYAEGFGLDYERNPSTDAKAKRMPRNETNQVFYDVTDNLRQYQLYGVPYFYDKDENGGTPIAYQKSSMVRYSENGVENIYISLTDNNTALPTDRSAWFLFEPTDGGVTSQLSVTPFVPVISASLSTPPTSPATGDMYLVGANPSGAWAGKADQLAEWSEKGWLFTNAPEGHAVGLSGEIYNKINGKYWPQLALDSQSGKWVYAEAGGTANALTANLAPAPFGIWAGMKIRLAVKTANTGAATLNVNGLGSKPIVRFDGNVLEGGELIASSIAELVFAKTGWMIVSPTRAAGFGYGQKYYDKPGEISFTVPKGVTLIDVEIWGAGGGGGGVGSAGNGSGGGGGGGAYVRKRMAVTPGQVLKGIVGAAGAGGGWGSSGTAGGTTSFAAIITATGGGGGGANPTGNGGGSGIASGGDINADGGGGTAGGALRVSGGTGGAAPFGGTGGGGGFGIGGPGTAPGGGGGASGGAQGNNGAAGSGGAIYIKW